MSGSVSHFIIINLVKFNRLTLVVVNFGHDQQKNRYISEEYLQQYKLKYRFGGSEIISTLDSWRGGVILGVVSACRL